MILKLFIGFDAISKTCEKWTKERVIQFWDDQVS